jgi:hypothetical protein
MMLKSSIVMLGAMMLFTSVSTKVLAEDINVTVNRGQIFANDTEGTLVSSPTGYRIFADNIRGSSKAINFFSDSGTFLPGEKLLYEAVSTLKYWNGDMWEAASIRTPGVAITNQSGGTTGIGPTMIVNPSGIIDTADLEGGINAQLTYAFGGTGRRPGGAYMFELALTSREDHSSASSSYLDSDPFYVVFNSTLTADDFSKSIDALVSPVPEPQSFAMLLVGLALCNFMTRRRRKTIT